MKSITTNEAKQFIIVKVDANGEPEGVLTRRASTYGASMAVSPFNLINLSVAVTRANTADLQLILDGFLMEKKTYKYDDFKIVEMEAKISITFGNEVPVNKERERIINNNRKLVAMAKEWGEQWKKDNPDKEGRVWEGTPFKSNYGINPVAREYFKTKLEELDWKEKKDYDYYMGGCKAYEAFVKKIEY